MLRSGRWGAWVMAVVAAGTLAGCSSSSPGSSGSEDAGTSVAPTSVGDDATSSGGGGMSCSPTVVINGGGLPSISENGHNVMADHRQPTVLTFDTGLAEGAATANLISATAIADGTTVTTGSGATFTVDTSLADATGKITMAEGKLDDGGQVTISADGQNLSWMGTVKGVATSGHFCAD